MKTFFGYIRNFFRGLDNFLTFLCIISPLFGFVLVYSATQSTNSAMRNVLIQSVCLVIGLAFMFLIAYFDYEIYMHFSKYILLFFFAALIVTFFVAKDVDGNRNWIDLKIIKLQTSEIAKVGFIITLTTHIAKVREKLNSPLAVLSLFIHFMCYAGPIVLQGDIGSVLVYLVMFVVMLFVAGLKYVYFAGAAVTAIISVPVLWNSIMPEYMKKRILTAFNPELDPLGIGYQAIQSKTALGSGQFLGNGLFEGIQTQYNLLPAKHTDFIFSVAGEELGFIGCMLIIVLLFFIILRVVLVGVRSKDDNGILLCAGVATMLAAQTIENIGMCVGVLPVIGITLPFFSYGGSSLMSVFFCMGVVQSVSNHSGELMINFRENPKFQ